MGVVIMIDFGTFKKAFADKLSLKLEEMGKVLPSDVINKMSDDFIEAVIDFKLKVAADRQDEKPKQKDDVNDPKKVEASMIIVKGEVAWTPSRQALIDKLASKFDEILKPIGGITPGERAAFWSQQGKVQAQRAGVNLESTVAGYLLEQIGNELTSTFTPSAYKSSPTKEEESLELDSPLSTATNIGIWNAISKVYAQGTEGDTHVYLVDGSTSYQSVFWNTELQELRLMQQRGEIKEIYLHTLKKDKLTEYESLNADKTAMVAAHKEQYQTQVQQLSASGMREPDKEAILAGTKAVQKDREQALAQKAQKILEDPNSWEKAPLADSKLKIKTSGFTGDRTKEPDVKYSTIVDAAARWKDKINPASRFREVVKAARNEAQKKVTEELKEDVTPKSQAPQ
jgi:hypothetical protein